MNVWMARVKDQVSAASATVWTVQAMGRLPGKYCGYIERISWTASKQVAEFSKTWIDPAVCRYSSRMSQ